MNNKVELLAVTLTVMAMFYVVTPKVKGADVDTFFTHPRGGIYKMSSTGQVGSVLPDSATSVAFDNDGNLYFVSFSRYKGDLIKMSPDQQVTNLGTIFDDPDPIALRRWDIDIAVNDIGEVYFTHPRGGIYKMSSTGQVSSVLPDSATSVAFDIHQDLYVSTFSHYKGDLIKMSPDQQVTNLGTIFDDPDPIALRRWDIDIAVNDIGEVYFTHPRGGIYKMSSTGQVSSVLPDSATSVAFDNDGNLYFVSFSRYKGDLIKMSPDQQVTNLGTIFDDPDPIALRRWDIDIAVIFPPIEAAINIDPDTLNLKSRSKWITCYIWLPEDYNVADIDPYSVLLEGEIETTWLWFDEEEQVAMAKFNRSEIQDILKIGQVELTVSGELLDGTMFKGTDVIRVIEKGRRKSAE